MENKNIIDEIIDIKRQRDIAYVNFFSDGTITKDDYKYSKDLENLKREEEIFFVRNTLLGAARMYSVGYSFDELDMHMKFGLIYSKDQVNDDNSLKENAVPLEDIVRYQATRVDGFYEGKKSNKEDYIGKYPFSGYLYYDEFVNAMMEAGLVVDGPKTFHQLKYAILNKDPFDVNLIASLNQEKNKELVRKM